MINILQKNSENLPPVDLDKETDSGKEVDSSREADSNSSSSEILDLSYKRTIQFPELTNVLKSFPILNSTSDEQQSTQQSSITSTSLTPMNLHVEIGTTKFTGNRSLPKKRKERSDNDGQINYYQINNVQINGQVDNDQFDNSQINCNQINSDKMLYKLETDRNIDTNYINIDQTIAKDINSNTSYTHRNSPLSIEQSISHEHSISMVKPIDTLVPTNIPMSNTHPMHTPMSMQDIEKSTILTSIASAPRPFKVYPRDPLLLSAGDKDTSDAYNTFRKNVLKHVKSTEKESTNGKMRRISNSTGSSMSSVDDNEKNRAYLEKRKKNNAAAKRSRDARRAKEDEIAIRAAFLEQENGSLRKIINMLMEQLHERNVQCDNRSIIEKNVNVLGSGHMSS